VANVGSTNVYGAVKRLFKFPRSSKTTAERNWRVSSPIESWTLLVKSGKSIAFFVRFERPASPSHWSAKRSTTSRNAGRMVWPSNTRARAAASTASGVDSWFAFASCKSSGVGGPPENMYESWLATSYGLSA
jgi:hypothetical protein